MSVALPFACYFQINTSSQHKPQWQQFFWRSSGTFSYFIVVFNIRISNPDHFQRLGSSILPYGLLINKTSSQSVHNSVSYPGHTHTNIIDCITSLAEVKKITLYSTANTSSTVTYSLPEVQFSRHHHLKCTPSSYKHMALNHAHQLRQFGKNLGYIWKRLIINNVPMKHVHFVLCHCLLQWQQTIHIISSDK